MREWIIYIGGFITPVVLMVIWCLQDKIRCLFGFHDYWVLPNGDLECHRYHCKKKKVKKNEKVELNYLTEVCRGVLDNIVATNLGVFLTSAVDHIEKGGNLASAEIVLTDGTKVNIKLERVKHD